MSHHVIDIFLQLDRTKCHVSLVYDAVEMDDGAGLDRVLRSEIKCIEMR